MPSKREQVLDALLERLRFVPAVEVRRGGELPVTIPAAGLLILRDGDPGEPEVTLSPLVYEYRHVAEVEVILQPVGDAADALDAVLVNLGSALEADRTLGGLCVWIEPEAPVPVDVPVEGALGVMATIVPVALTYTTTGPLA